MELGFAIIASAGPVLSMVAYFAGVFGSGSYVKPSRITSFGNLAFAAVAFVTYLALGASNSLVYFGAVLVMASAVFFLSIFDSAESHTRFDLAGLLVILVGVAAWLVIGDPIYSVAALLVVAVLAAWQALLDLKHKPEDQTRLNGVMMFAAAILIALSERNAETLLLMALPVAWILQAVLLTVAITLQRTKHVASEPAELV